MVGTSRSSTGLWSRLRTPRAQRTIVGYLFITKSLVITTYFTAVLVPQQLVLALLLTPWVRGSPFSRPSTTSRPSCPS